MVSAGELRKLWESLSELRSSVCERRLERTLRPALLPVKTAQFTKFFRQVDRHPVKSLSLTESVLGAFRFLYWQFLTDLSEQPICPMCKGQEAFFLNPEDGTYRLSRNVGKETPPYTAYYLDIVCCFCGIKCLCFVAVLKVCLERIIDCICLNY
jgi:hypothetical protein